MRRIWQKQIMENIIQDLNSFNVYLINYFSETDIFENNSLEVFLPRNLMERINVKASIDGKIMSSTEELKKGRIINRRDTVLSIHNGIKTFFICKNIDTIIIKINIKFA